MTAQISVIVPRTKGIPDRDAIWEYIKPRFDGYHIIEVDDPTSKLTAYNKAAAITSAISKIRGNIVIMSDADVWCDKLQLAINAVLNGAPFAIPHKHIHRLSKTTTEKLLANEPVQELEYVRKQRVVKGGGLIVLHRDVIKAHLPDTRFVGWGHEDRAWYCELHTFYPNYWQGSATLYHMYHEWQTRRKDKEQEARNKQLSLLYKRYMGNKNKMSKKLLATKPILDLT